METTKVWLLKKCYHSTDTKGGEGVGMLSQRIQEKVGKEQKKWKKKEPRKDKQACIKIQKKTGRKDICESEKEMGLFEEIEAEKEMVMW